MRLNPAAFDRFLAGNQGIGQEFLWRRSSACPCISPHSGAANPSCPLCSGKGRVWAAPVQARAGMTQQGNIKKFGPMGMYEMGDATLTIPQSSPMYEAGQFDRITLLNSTELCSLVLTRGAPNEKIYRRVLDVSRVWWIGSSPDEVVEGGHPAFNADGTLSWSSGAPPTGKMYSISFTANDEYFIWDNQTSDRAEHFGAKLPKKLIARRFDLFGR